MLGCLVEIIRCIHVTTMLHTVTFVCADAWSLGTQNSSHWYAQSFWCSNDGQR